MPRTGHELFFAQKGEPEQELGRGSSARIDSSQRLLIGGKQLTDGKIQGAFLTNTGPLSCERGPALYPALYVPAILIFLLTRWLRNILFVMFFEESVARE